MTIEVRTSFCKESLQQNVRKGAGRDGQDVTIGRQLYEIMEEGRGGGGRLHTILTLLRVLEPSGVTLTRVHDVDGSYECLIVQMK